MKERRWKTNVAEQKKSRADERVERRSPIGRIMDDREVGDYGNAVKLAVHGLIQDFVIQVRRRVFERTMVSLFFTLKP